MVLYTHTLTDTHRSSPLCMSGWCLVSGAHLCVRRSFVLDFSASSSIPLIPLIPIIISPLHLVPFPHSLYCSHYVNPPRSLPLWFYSQSCALSPLPHPSFLYSSFITSHPSHSLTFSLISRLSILGILLSISSSSSPFISFVFHHRPYLLPCPHLPRHHHLLHHLLSSSPFIAPTFILSPLLSSVPSS